jgi:Pectate lyase superfamily protein
MTTVTLFYDGIQQFTDNNGAPLVNGTVGTFQAGTNIPAPTYTDSTGSQPLQNPIPLNARGEPQNTAGTSVGIWGPPNTAYKFVVSDAAGNVVRMLDNVIAPLTSFTLTQAAIGAVLYPQTAAEIAAAVTPTNYAYPPLNVLRYGADPTGNVDATAIINNAISVAFRQNGGSVFMPAGTYKISNTITMQDGVSILGAGCGSNATPCTLINATSLTGATVAIALPGMSNVTLKDFYLSGPSVPCTMDLIQTTLTNRRLCFENLIIVSTGSTGAGISLSPAGGGSYTIITMIKNVTCAGMGYGFRVGPTCTSVDFLTTYGNACTSAGYLIQGTYISLNGTACDTNHNGSNTAYGYLLQNCTSVTLNGCGAENNDRSAIALVSATGVVFNGFRAVANNKGGSASFGALADIQNGTRSCTFIGCVDSAPTVGTTVDVSNTAGSPGVDNQFLSCVFAFSPFGVSTTNFGLYVSSTAPNFFAGDMQIAGGAQAIMHAVTTVSGAPTGQTPTLGTNGPVAGPPTKWIPFNDAGSTRYIPSW